MALGESCLFAVKCDEKEANLQVFQDAAHQSLLTVAIFSQNDGQGFTRVKNYMILLFGDPCLIVKVETN